MIFKTTKTKRFIDFIPISILTAIIISPNTAMSQDIKDFPNLKNFQERNALLFKQPTDSKRVVFMGDSITQFWDVGEYNIFNNPHYINRGISGQTTSQMLLRFRQDVVALKPRKVIILAGTNDIAGNTGYVTIETIMGNIKSMSEIAKANNIQVILCKLVPAKSYPWSKSIKPAPLITELNNEIAKYAMENRLHVIDYYTLMAMPDGALNPAYTGDGVHPNAAGYKIMKYLVENELGK